MKLCKNCTHYGGSLPSGITGYCRRPVMNPVNGTVAPLGGLAPAHGQPFMFAEHQRGKREPCGLEAHYFEPLS